MGFYCFAYQVSHKGLKIYRFLYTGFLFQEYIKKIWDVPQPQQSITIWRVQKYAGRLNLLVLMYGFQCIVYQVSQKRPYQATGSYIWVLVCCVPGVTRKVLPIYRFLYMGFNVLCSRCHTKGPTNLQVLIYGFQCIVYQVSHKRSQQFTGSYIRDFSFRNTSRRFGMFHNHNSQSLFGECRSMPGFLIYWFLYMGFNVLSARCHTKVPTNLQILIDGIFLLGIHQEGLGCSSTTTGNHHLESAEVCQAS